MSRCSAVVTGATGFVGRHLVKHLLDRGWLVHAIARPASNCSHLTDLGENFTLYTHNGSIDALIEQFQTIRPSIVFHLASLFLSEHQPKDVEPLIQSNLLFGTQLVEAMTQGGVTALVNTGTAWQHYEGRDYSPVNLYAATKQAFEALLQYYIEARGLRVITLKLHDTYGPDDARPKLINRLRHVALTSESLEMSPGEQLIDLLHVDDVSEAFRVAAMRILDGCVSGHECYCLSSGFPMTLRALVEQVEQLLDRTLPITWGGRPYREREVMEPWRGPTLPGWAPSRNWVTGISQTLSR